MEVNVKSSIGYNHSDQAVATKFWLLVSVRPVSLVVSIRITLWLFNIAMENPSSMEV